MADPINKAAEEIVIEKLKELQERTEKAATKTELNAISSELAEFKKNYQTNHEEMKTLIDTLNEKAGRFVNQNETKAVRLSDHLEKQFTEQKDKLAELAKKDSRAHFGFSLEAKSVADMSLTNNLTGSGGVPNYRPGIIGLPFEPRHFRSLVPVLPSALDIYHFIRHKETVGEGSIYWQSAENAAKNQRDYDFEDITVNLKALAGYTKVSRQMLRNVPGLAAYLGQYLPDDYMDAEDTEAYTALKALSGSMTTGDASGGYEGIIKTMGLLGNKKYGANAIVVRPATLSELLLRKDNYNAYTYPGAINMTTDGTLRIMGVPVMTATWVGADEAILGDWRQFAIIQSEAMSVRSTDTDQDDFIKNRVTYLVEATIGFAGFRPAAFSIIDLGFSA